MVNLQLKYITDIQTFSYSKSKYSPFRNCINTSCEYHNKQYREHCEMKVFPIKCRYYIAFQNKELNKKYIEGQFYASYI